MKRLGYKMKFIKFILTLFTFIVIFTTLLFIISAEFRYNVFLFLHLAEDNLQTSVETISEQYESLKVEGDTSANELVINQTVDKIIKSISKSGPKNKNLSPEPKVDQKEELDIVDVQTASSSDTLNHALIEEKDSSETFEILNQGISFLSKNDGIIYVESQPEEAWIIIEGKKLGKTPLTIRVNPAGLYRVKLEKKFLRTWEKIVKVNPGQITEIQANLKKGRTILTVLSDPQRASVFLNDKYMGDTPITIKPVESGKHKIYLVSGNKEYDGIIELLSGENKIIDVPLQNLRTEVFIQSEPSGANIFLDGKFSGKTPITIQEVKYGRHELICISNQDLAYADSIDVSAESDNEFTLELNQRHNYHDIFSANLKITSEYEKTFVRINGRNSGVAPITMNHLRKGQHEIFLIKSVPNGSYYYKNVVFLNAFENKELNITRLDFKFKNYE
jgi:hypothetical protein